MRHVFIAAMFALASTAFADSYDCREREREWARDREQEVMFGGDSWGHGERPGCCHDEQPGQHVHLGGND